MNRWRNLGLEYPKNRAAVVVCGTSSAYRQGCRCEPCRDARRAVNDRHRKSAPLSDIERDANLPMTARPVGQEWREHALCTQVCKDGTHNPAWWTDHDPKHLRAVLEICNACPVLEPCRQWAFELPEPVGVWGGTLPKERNR